MKEQFYKVILISDVVLNSSLATEGNMKTLDYIPGSNFLGIVAAKLYKEIDSEHAFSIFHSGKVRFGDANISINNSLSYPIPASFSMEKGKMNLGQDDVYLHHLLNSINPLTKDGTRFQLKQQRNGYLFKNGQFKNEIEKSFAIKSAQERKTRTSKEGAMFGFESLNKGLEFIFSVQLEDETNLELINKALIGKHRLGKSRNAEFGQIEITSIDSVNQIEHFNDQSFVLVYAQSNLCFLNDFGVATFQPSAEQLGLNKEAIIDWSKSQIRTFSYSPWNFKRNSSNSQRYCIAKGSVFYVTAATIIANTATVGIHQAEGLGKVIYNPRFLEGNIANAKSNFNFVPEQKDPKKTNAGPTTVLTRFLAKNVKECKVERDISAAIQKLVYSKENNILNLKRISSSQWGGIRAYATKAKSFDELKTQLFDEKIGYLNHGVADEKYWGKNRGANRKTFEEIFEKHKGYDTLFIAKFAAEMAKESRKITKTNN
jgi:hypothetical protein